MEGSVRRKRAAVTGPRNSQRKKAFGRRGLTGILEYLADGVFVFDSAWRFAFVDPKGAEFLGRSPEELIGREIWSLFPQAVGSPFYTEAHRALGLGEPAQAEVFSAPLDRWFECRFHPSAAGLLVYARDISERKRAEEALRESNQFNRQIIENAGEGITVYDHDLRYVVWNPFMEQLTGRPASEVVGRRASDLFPHLREQGVLALLERALGGEQVNSPETPFRVPETGRSGWVIGSYSPQRNAAGEIIGVIGLIRDITEYKRSEDALKMSELRGARLQTTAEMGLTVAHELRQPLAVLRGYLEFIARKDLPEARRRQYLAEMERAARDLDDKIGVIERLRDYVTKSYGPGMTVVDLERSARSDD